jgi:membrane protein
VCARENFRLSIEYSQRLEFIAPPSIFPLVSKWLAKYRKLRKEAVSLWDESALASQDPLSRVAKFFHFWILAWKSFTRNRCPVRASALAYVTLLALIPMLAVVVSITSTFLKKEGEDKIDEFIIKIVASVTPPAELISTNAPSGETNSVVIDTNSVGSSTNSLRADTSPTSPQQTNYPVFSSHSTNSSSRTVDTNALPAFVRDAEAVKARKTVARNINQFIQNTRSGTLGVTGGVLLIFAAISMLTRIEDTLNDIWGVARGRSWFMRIILYWGVISLAPLLLVVALGLSSGPHLESTKNLLTTMPFFGNLLFRALPVLMLCLTFAVFYMLMPNTKVRLDAALVGGFVGGLLFHLNNAISVLYVSRVVSNSKIYGSLGLVPVFMIGLYFSWLLLLFGAQVAYAFQNRATYVEERQVENVNQRGREFVALRLMTAIGQRFLTGGPPPSVVELGQELCVPTRLIQRTMLTLAAARLVVEAAGQEPAYLPARPLEQRTCHDVLLAMRASQGHEMATRDEPARSEVYGEFNRIQEAERHAADSVTLLALATRASSRQLS